MVEQLRLGKISFECVTEALRAVNLKGQPEFECSQRTLVLESDINGVGVPMLVGNICLVVGESLCEQFRSFYQ